MCFRMCPGGFIEHAQKFHKVSTDRLSWHEARFECLGLDVNYDLAIIDNLELFEFLKKWQPLDWFVFASWQKRFQMGG